jgi:hypothetical protein
MQNSNNSFIDADNRKKMAEFNNNFENNKIKQYEKNKMDEIEKLNKLNIDEPVKKLYEYTIMENLIDIKNTFFDILDGILNKTITYDIFTKNNNMYFFGIILVIIGLLII